MLLFIIIVCISSIRKRENEACGQVVEAHGFVTIVLLAMNRASSLQSALQSLQETIFCGDYVRLIIRFDKGDGQNAAIEVADKFNFSHGEKQIIYPTISMGLAASWLHAWQPTYEEEVTLILEDDIVLSRFWYCWLRQAWTDNMHRVDLAGISLQRQTLIPLKTARSRADFQSQQGAFLYPLVGSIGFSPHPQRWNEFLRWVEAVDFNQFDVSVMGLITSDWWQAGNKRDMWTQHFIYFCLQRQLLTLYVNPPSLTALATHTRSRGVHFVDTVGPDFEPLSHSHVKYSEKAQLHRYTWDGTRIKGHQDEISKRLILSTIITRAKEIMMKNNFVYMMFLNHGYTTITLNWICSVKTLNGKVLKNAIFIVSDFDTASILRNAHPDLNFFVQESSATLSRTEFGTFEYYSVVQARILVQNELIQAGVSIQIIEPDQIWLKDITSLLRHKLMQHDIVAGDETAFTSQHEKKICGGFYGVRSTARTKRIFDSYTRQYTQYLSNFKAFEGKHGRIPHFEDDQVFLTKFLLSMEVKIDWLAHCDYANGLWFDKRAFRAHCPKPAVIHNNFIVGVRGKIGRAIFHDHWHLKSDLQCPVRGTEVKI